MKTANFDAHFEIYIEIHSLIEIRSFRNPKRKTTCRGWETLLFSDLKGYD